VVCDDDVEFLRDLIARSRWVFAKTMPDNPHWYTLRKEADDSEFVRFVELIRAHGREEPYEGQPYTVLDVDEWFYWTMGAPVDETILVNREPRV
jgi:hypothetical protein